MALEGEEKPEPRLPSAVKVPAIRIPQPWGFWATSAWVALAVSAGILVTGWGVPWLQRAGVLGGWTLLANTSDVNVMLFFLVVLAVLAGAVRLAGWSVPEYLGLGRPSHWDFRFIIICLIIAYMPGELARTLGFGLSDRDTDIQEYAAARAFGTLPLMWMSIVVVGPIIEEAIYRGFIFRGWSQSFLGGTGTILLTSVLFGLTHQQYSWLGIADVTVFGLVAGWARWQTGTILIPILLHAICNLIDMIRTALVA